MAETGPWKAPPCGLSGAAGGPACPGCRCSVGCGGILDGFPAALPVESEPGGDPCQPLGGGAQSEPECWRPLRFLLGGRLQTASTRAFPQPGAADSHPRPGPHPSQHCHTGRTGLPGPALPSLPTPGNAQPLPWRLGGGRPRPPAPAGVDTQKGRGASGSYGGEAGGSVAGCRPEAQPHRGSPAPGASPRGCFPCSTCGLCLPRRTRPGRSLELLQGWVSPSNQHGCSAAANAS